MSIGQRIVKRRRELDVTQQQLAAALGVTPQYISLIENDKKVPSVSSITKIASELGTSLDYLVVGKEGISGDPIAAIKADEKLSLKSKKAIIALIEEYHGKSDQ